MPKLDDQQKQRLRAIKQAGVVGVTAAAREAGVSRITVYKWIQRYEAEGVAGLSDRSHRPHHHPHTTAPDVVEVVVELALAHPTWGCRKIVGALAERNISLSEPTVQYILVNRGLGLIEQRDRKSVV